MKILAHVHLYYYDQAELLMRRLVESIGSRPRDIYVTMRDEDAGAIAAVKKYAPDAIILKVKNVGADVWPFIYVLGRVDLSEYDYIVKIHSKRFITEYYEMPSGFRMHGWRWRDMLISFLRPRKFDNIMTAFAKDEKLGMVGDTRCILTATTDCTWHANPGELLERLGYKKTAEPLPWIGGTMFVARAHVMRPLLNLGISEKDFETFQSGKSGKMEHRLETLMGNIVACQGYKVADVYNGRLVIFLAAICNWLWHKIIYNLFIKHFLVQ